MTILYPNYMDALNHAIPMTQENASGFLHTVQEMAHAAGVPKPLHVEYVPSSMPNATFRNTQQGKALSFSDGLFGLFGHTDLHHVPNGELKAVIGHELSHARYRFQEAATRVTLLAGIPMAGMGAMYLIDKTNDKLRKNGQLHPDKPQAWWDAFHEAWADIQKMGVTGAISDFTHRAIPGMASITTPQPSEQPNNTPANNADNDPWARGLLQESKYLAVGAAMLIPALAACHSTALLHEYRADKFAVALTGNKEMANALRRVEHYTEKALAEGAKTPMEKSWAGRVIKSIRDYFVEASEGAHPATRSRIEAIEKINIAEAKNYFGL